MTLETLARRPAGRLLTAAILSALTVYFTCTLLAYRLPGPRFLIAVTIGLALSALSVLLVVGRLLTTPPEFLGLLAGHAENVVFLLVLNLIILSFLSPVFRAIAAAPMQNPIAQQMFAIAGELSGRVLLGLFTAGAVVLPWALLLHSARCRPARALGRVLDGLLTTILVLYCIGVGALAANSVLDGSAPTEHRSEIVAVSGVNGPFGLGQLAWADVRSWTAPGQVERVLLIAGRDQLSQEHALPGLPVRVFTHAGFFGVPWVGMVAWDETRQHEQILESLPTAAAFRKSVILALIQQRRWKELRAHAEAHLRAYPNDREYVLVLARGLRAEGQTDDAAALERAAQP